MDTVKHDRLILQTADILELLLDPESTTAQRGKQKLVQSVNEFNKDVLNAKESAYALPGGELLIEEQEEIIEMLEQLKQRKRQILNRFASDIAQNASSDNTKMEVDSTASTPS